MTEITISKRNTVSNEQYVITSNDADNKVLLFWHHLPGFCGRTSQLAGGFPLGPLIGSVRAALENHRPFYNLPILQAYLRRSLEQVLEYEPTFEEISSTVQRNLNIEVDEAVRERLHTFGYSETVDELASR